MNNETKMYYTLVGVMHSVDKWLEGDELKADEVNRAATMREKTLRIIESLQAENAKLRSERDAEAEDNKLLGYEIDRLTAENAILLRQRAPEHRSELDDVEIVQTAKDIEATALKNMGQALTAADALGIG
jgi:hypothetical protein